MTIVVGVAIDDDVGPWFVAFEITSLLASWIAFWRRPGETYFDFSTRTLWAKFTHLAEAATIPVITIYVVAFVITAFIV